MSINERIQEVREDAKLTKKAFADRLNVDPSHISHLERGRANPSHLLIKFISTEFNVDRDWLLNGQGEKYVERKTQANIPRVSVKALRKLVSLISEDESEESNSSDIRARLLGNQYYYRILLRTMHLMIPLMSSHQTPTLEEFQSTLEILELETEPELPTVHQTRDDRSPTPRPGRTPLLRLFDDPELTQDQVRTILEKLVSGYERKTGKNLFPELEPSKKVNDNITKPEFLEFTGDTIGNLTHLRTCINLLEEIQNLDSDKLSDVKTFLEGIKVGLKP
jgi:transcriptional regulator with XRE-family HTH domain